MRTRIATDLHDDIGANLSLIAMISEVARGNFQHDDLRMKEGFSTIAATSRDTVDSMSDIVWAVNPKRDHLRDLTQRMRRFAQDVCGARGIDLQFRAPEPGRDLKLGPDLRREVSLIFKESINNIVQHSGCTAADVEVQVTRGQLSLQVRDNSRGFDSPGTNPGSGLDSMQARAKKLGGSLEVTSLNASGVNVTLRVPLDQRGRSIIGARLIASRFILGNYRRRVRGKYPMPTVGVIAYLVIWSEAHAEETRNHLCRCCYIAARFGLCAATHRRQRQPSRRRFG